MINNYKKTNVITSGLTLTTSYQDVGSEINCFGYKTAHIYISIDINQASDVVIYVLGKLDAGGTAEYALPIQATGTAEINVDKAEYEINYDADQHQMFRVEIEGVPFLQIQAKERTDGGTDAVIEHCYVILT